MATAATLYEGLRHPRLAPFAKDFESWDACRAGSGTPSIEALWEEWYPLRGALLPISPAVADDPLVIPCVAPAGEMSGPVLVWDFAGQLDEQPEAVLADTFEEWAALRETERNKRITLALRELDAARAEAPRTRSQGLKRFETIADEFGLTHGFDHEAGGPIPRAVRWRPIRIASKDIILAVTAARFNRDHLTVDVCAWAAADHTMFARGTAVRNALELLVAEAARNGAVNGIRFVSGPEADARPAAAPRDVKVLGRLLGLPDVGDSLSANALRRLDRFLAAASEPFPALEIDESWVERAAAAIGVRESELLHLCRQRVWTASEVQMLARSCPAAGEALRGRISPDRDGMTFEAAWAHLRAARFIDSTARALGSGGDDETASSSLTLEPRVDGPCYGFRLVPRGDVSVPFDRLTRDGDIESFTVHLEESITIVPVAISAERILECAPLMSRLDATTYLSLPAEVASLPRSDRAEIGSALLRTDENYLISPIDLVTVDEELLLSLVAARSIGSQAATLANESPGEIRAAGALIVRRLPPEHEEPSLLTDQIARFLDRLRSGLDHRRSFNGAARLLAARAAGSRGGTLAVEPSEEVAARERSLAPRTDRTAVLGAATTPS